MSLCRVVHTGDIKHQYEVFLEFACLCCCSTSVEGDRGAGAWENRGWEGYGRREEKGREAGFLKWREPGEKEKNFAIFRNILQ